MRVSEEHDGESRSAEPERVSPAVPPTRIRVLCVDDDAATNRLHALVLAEEPDIEVVGELLDADGVLDAVERHRPDVVLLDLVMGKDTVGTCELLRERFPRVRILALSGMERADMVESILRAGASGFLLKALDFERIAPAIRKVAQGERLVLLHRRP